MSCALPPTVGMSGANYSPDGTNQFVLTVTSVGLANHVNGDYTDGTVHHVKGIAYSACCVANTWGCGGGLGCGPDDAWRVLSDARSKVPA